MLLEHWSEKKDWLYRIYKFEDFVHAMMWMVQVSYEVDKLDHHPEWTNTYNKVAVRLVTHDQWDIVTEKDRTVAEIMDDIYSRFA